MKPGPPAWRTFRPYRRLCQMSVVVAFIVIPFLNLRDITFFSGNLLSFSAGGFSVVDPLAALQVIATSGDVNLELACGAGFVLALAFVLGRVFCSWLCPYGFFSELVHKFRRRPAPSVTAGAGTFFLRVFPALAGVLCVAAFAPSPWLNQLSMPGWFTRFAQHAAFFGVFLPGALLLPAALALECALQKRLWCRYLCPQAVLPALCACLKGGARVAFRPKRCACGKGDRPCRKACSLGLDPRRQTLAQRFECTSCGDCVDACHRVGSGALRIGQRPTRVTPDS
ncbi:MAG: 4Fe-4S binding protein [Desulfovibrio sp.]|nr:4Fe-4S binding protein [Desulfovibrio sp.]